MTSDHMIQLSIFGDTAEEQGMEADASAMFVSLHFKAPMEFFWLRRIRGVDISKCCAKCFIGDSDTRMYHGTRGRTPNKIELNFAPGRHYLAYYLCGLSKGYVHHLNTHIAFQNVPGEILKEESSQISVSITNARKIDFLDYKPNPPGYFNEYQRKCRNWIFANFVRDGMLPPI